MLEKFVSIFTTENTFESDLREILKWQWSQNPVYRRFSENIGYDAASLTGMRAAEVPLLPVEAFRDTRLYAAGDHPPELYFQSSGTTGMVRSRHEVAYENVYRQAIMQGIQQFYPIENMVVLGYTPGYNDNPDSSLIWMINELIRHDTTGLSAFLPVGQPITAGLLAAIEDTEKSVLLFGAAFGLVDLAERHPVLLPQGSIIMETGGDENLPPGDVAHSYASDTGRRIWYTSGSSSFRIRNDGAALAVLCTGRQLVCVSALGAG